MIRFTQVTWYSQLLAIALAVGIFWLGLFVGKQQVSVQNTEINSQTEISPLPVVEEEQQATSSSKVLSFVWQYDVIAGTADYPKTEVVLMVRKEGKDVDFKKIATVDGSCNLLLDEPVYALGSQQLLCYYAGFGYQFRVVADGENYAVQQKEIEEASPDYNPPIAEFRTIMTIHQ